MAQTRAFSLGGIGSPCCCSQAGCNVVVNTLWCPGCPTTGTVTVQTGSLSGPVFASGPIDSTGHFAFKMPQSASGTTFFFSAVGSGPGAGFLNRTSSMTIDWAGDNVPCQNDLNGNDALPFTALYPPQLSCSSPFGSVTLLPSGSQTNCQGTITGSLGTYIATQAYAYGGGCGCGGATVNIDYQFIPCTTSGDAHLTLLFWCSGTPAGQCPGGNSGSTGAQCTAWGAIGMTGVGPRLPIPPTVCYPVNLTANVGTPFGGGVSCVTRLLGDCIGAGGTYAFAVTQ